MCLFSTKSSHNLSSDRYIYDFEYKAPILYICEEIHYKIRKTLFSDIISEFIEIFLQRMLCTKGVVHYADLIQCFKTVIFQIFFRKAFNMHTKFIEVR